jgi:hypothetical protein
LATKYTNSFRYKTHQKFNQIGKIYHLATLVPGNRTCLNKLEKGELIKWVSDSSAVSFFHPQTRPQTGWPNWANFHRLGYCLLRVFYVKIAKVAQSFMLLFRGRVVH